MRLIFITEARFIVLKNKCVYCSEGSFSQSLFQRYLEHFEHISIFARAKNGDRSEILPENQISHESISLQPLPFYMGFNQFILRFIILQRWLIRLLPRRSDPDTAIICRIPGRVGATAIRILKKRKISYGIEVVGDPYDVLSQKATNHLLLPIIRYFSYHSLKKIAWHAPAALYVTKNILQKRYPCRNYNLGVSDVALPASLYVKQPKKFPGTGIIRLICVGSLDQMQKAPDIIIMALKKLVDSGYNLSLTWVGGGKYLKKMITLSETLNLDKSITFLGKLPAGTAVMNELDKADIFVMASRMEGLPRAMVEAMARALPCIGTNIGGIPELLEQIVLIPVNNSDALAKKIEFLINNPEITKNQSSRNLYFSFQFEEKILSSERGKFFDYLKEITVNWDGK